MQDRPTFTELLAAVRIFVETDVVPKLDGPQKFHARVAANVLGIVERELLNEDTHLRGELQRLADLLGRRDSSSLDRLRLRDAIRDDTLELCRRIQAGDADSGEWRDAVLAHVRATIREKLEVANPKYLEADDQLHRRRS